VPLNVDDASCTDLHADRRSFSSCFSFQLLSSFIHLCSVFVHTAASNFLLPVNKNTINSVDLNMSEFRIEQ